MRGYVTLGILEAMWDGIATANRFSGCSIGAVIAAALAAGQTPRDIIGRIRHVDVAWQPGRGAMITPLGLDGGLRRVVQMLLGIPEGTIFADLPGSLTVCATNVATQRAAYFSTETTPGANVLDAVTASCSIPVLYPPTVIDGVPYIDGAFSDSLPMPAECCRILAFDYDYGDQPSVIGVFIRAGPLAPGARLLKVSTDCPVLPLRGQDVEALVASGRDQGRLFLKKIV